MESTICKIKDGPGPIIAVANHNGHALHEEVAEIMALDVDLNRPRDTAVYLTPDDAWGLEKVRARNMIAAH